MGFVKAGGPRLITWKPSSPGRACPGAHIQAGPDGSSDPAGVRAESALGPGSSPRPSTTPSTGP